MNVRCFASVSYRPATAGDAEAIAHVLRSSRLAYLPYAPPRHTEEEDLAWVRRMLIPTGGVTVALDGDALVGVLAVSTGADGSWIDQLYIAPEHCGRGIGTRLLGQALGDLPRPVRLYTFRQNRLARRFYERFGFRAIRFGDGSGNEEGCPDVLYELAGEVL